MKYREIGSEFWDVPTQKTENSLFPDYTQWYISGRSALQAITRELEGCHSVAMPAWCCYSMVKPFIEKGFDVHYYPVYWNNGLTIEIDYNCDVVFLIDYFGYTSNYEHIHDNNCIIVRDVTHSLLSSNYTDADFYFGSLRKWCGVWTGGYAWAEDGRILEQGKDSEGRYKDLRKSAMQLKKSYINNALDCNGIQIVDKKYLSIFSEAESLLEDIDVVSADPRDVNLAKRLNVNFIKTIRRNNARILINAFHDWLIFPDLKRTDCPLFVPIIVPDGKRDKLRNYLIKNDIYCPIHWPISEYHKLDDLSKELYDNELSLVCDQRYSDEDMKFIVETINNFLG